MRKNPSHTKSARRPRGLRVRITGDQIELSWNRHNRNAKFLIFAGIAMMAAALFSPNESVVVVALLPIGLGLAELGWTSIKLDRDRLVVRARPMLLSRAIKHEIPSSAIQQVFVVERTIGRHEIHLILSNRQSHRLCAESLGGDLNIDVALYIEAVIEGFLGLADRPIPGEINAKSAAIREDTNVQSLGPSEGIDRAKHTSEQERFGEAGGSAPIPDGFKLTQDENRLTISWPEKRLDQTAHWIVWLSSAFFVILIAMIVVEGNLAALLALLISGALCLAFFLPKIVRYFTRISITTDRRDLCVGYAPSLFRRSQRISVQEIRQIYVAEHLHTEPWTHVRRVRRRDYYEFHLTAMVSGKQVLAVLDQAHCALFLEQELERFLRIADRRMPDEPRSKYAV